MKWTVAMLMLLTGTAHAADFRQSVTPNGKDVQIRITSTIEFNDAELFKKQVDSAKLLGSDKRIVIDLRSPGGNFMGGLLIAELIHDDKLKTWVRADKSCTSICAIMWLAGFERFAKSTSLIGFHAAYDGTTGQETGKGNAILGSMLTKWGYDLEAVAFVTTAGPNDILYLSRASAQKYGIKFRGELPTEEYIQLVLQKHQSSPQTTTQAPTALDLTIMCGDLKKSYSVSPRCASILFTTLGKMEDKHTFACLPNTLSNEKNAFIVWVIAGLIHEAVEGNPEFGSLPVSQAVRRAVIVGYCEGHLPKWMREYGGKSLR